MAKSTFWLIFGFLPAISSIFGVMTIQKYHGNLRVTRIQNPSSLRKNIKKLKKLQLIEGEHRPIQKTKKRHFHKNQLFDKTKILGAFSVPYLSMLGRVDSSYHFPETQKYFFP